MCANQWPPLANCVNADDRPLPNFSAAFERSPDSAIRGNVTLMSDARNRSFAKCVHVGAVHWSTSSARDSRDWGIVRPMAFAVLRLMTNSNLLGCSIGMSPGFSPFRILSAMTTTRGK